VGAFLLARRKPLSGSPMAWIALKTSPARLGLPFFPADYSASLRSRSALAMTETELKVIAALAMMGLKSSPKTG
jgi:hypothetical protein